MFYNKLPILPLSSARVFLSYVIHMLTIRARSFSTFLFLSRKPPLVEFSLTTLLKSNMDFVIFQVFSVNQKSSANFQLILRLVQMIVFLAIIGGVSVAVAITKLTLGDVFACVLSLIPTGWGLLSVRLLILTPFHFHLIN